MRSTLGRAAAAALALGLLAAGCSKSTPSASPSAPAASSAAPSAAGSASPTTTTIGSDTANNHGSAEVTSKTSLDMVQGDFYFGPTILSGSAGQTLTIKLTNNGKVTHNFSIDSQHIDKTLSPGQSASVTVTFPTSGFTEFYCKFHRSLGMVGELTVA